MRLRPFPATPSGAAIPVFPLVAIALIVACGGSDGAVEPPAASVLTTVTVTPASASVFRTPPGNTVSLIVTAKDQKGQTMAGSTSFSSNNEAVATVSSAGVVTAVSAGSVQIAVTVTSGGQTRTGFASVSVQDPPDEAAVLASIIASGFQPPAVHIQAGGSVTWTMVGVPHSVDFTTAGAPVSIPVVQDASASRTFPTTGSYAYLCEIHPSMVGVVHVH
ncbi:hypothetical protein BH23GEM2_BH23GEM2_25940 [soil metagenome]